MGYAIDQDKLTSGIAFHIEDFIGQPGYGRYMLFFGIRYPGRRDLLRLAFILCLVVKKIIFAKTGAIFFYCFYILRLNFR